MRREILEGIIKAEKFAEQVALAYDYMIAEKEDEK